MSNSWQGMKYISLVSVGYLETRKSRKLRRAVWVLRMVFSFCSLYALSSMSAEREEGMFSYVQNKTWKTKWTSVRVDCIFSLTWMEMHFYLSVKDTHTDQQWFKAVVPSPYPSVPPTLHSLYVSLNKLKLIYSSTNRDSKTWNGSVR